MTLNAKSESLSPRSEVLTNVAFMAFYTPTYICQPTTSKCLT